MLEKIKQYQPKLQHFIQELRDVRAVGMGLFVVIVLLVSWSGVKAINANYVLQKQIAGMEQQNAVKKLANENLKLQNDYYNTPQYLELAARQDFGLAAPGETVLVVPLSAAMARTVELPEDKAAAKVAGASTARQPFWQRNFNAWMEFFTSRH
jgi:cell division protein FtsB